MTMVDGLIMFIFVPRKYKIIVIRLSCYWWNRCSRNYKLNNFRLKLTFKERKACFELGNFDYSETERIIREKYNKQWECDSNLQEHIVFLKTLEICGVTNHLLVFEKPALPIGKDKVLRQECDIEPVDDKSSNHKGQKKGDSRGPQSNREDYAAIDIHNINLIYQKRKLVEDLLDDMKTFNDQIVGTFVRIRIQPDIYRLVQVTGSSEGAPYTLGKRTTCVMLEILNLGKSEIKSINSISNEEFTEDECKRLRQNIKCGLISTLTVGDVLDKAMKLHMVRVNNFLETEAVRLNHLADLARVMGSKKELRECEEKLHFLKTPAERWRRIEEFPLVHDDPTMDPDCSEDETEGDDKKQGGDPFLQQPVVLEKPTTVASKRETPVAPESTPRVNETEKMWQYKDPCEKI